MPSKKFELLEPGNKGNKTANRNLAVDFFLRFFENSKRIDTRTILLDEYGICHVAAYTSAAGAMVSDTHQGGDYAEQFGDRDHWIMFREVGDGRCFIFICKPSDLIGHQDIGKGGVSWKKVNSVALMRKAIKTDEVKKILSS